MTENEAIKAICEESIHTGILLGCRKQFAEALAKSLDALKEIQQYRAIGTVEECRAAVENYRPRVTNAIPIGNKYYICSCGSVVKDGEKCLRCGDTIDRTEEGAE